MVLIKVFAVTIRLIVFFDVDRACPQQHAYSATAMLLGKGVMVYRRQTDEALRENILLE